MTNGEKILSTFPNAITRTIQNEGFTYIEVETDEWITGFDDTWWNAEYEEPVISEYIKREVLDKIRAEIKQYQSDYDVHGTEYDRTAWKAFNRCLQILDKYKTESEK